MPNKPVTQTLTTAEQPTDETWKARALAFAQALVDVMDGVQDHHIQDETGLPLEDCANIAENRKLAQQLLKQNAEAPAEAGPNEVASDETPFTVRAQGTVKLPHNTGYMLSKGPDCACFYIDIRERAYVDASTTSDSDCPIVFLCASDDDEHPTEIEFTDFPGWQFHSSHGGKSIGIALTRRKASTQPAPASQISLHP